MTDATSAKQAVTEKSGKSRVGGVWAPAGFSWALFEFARNPYFMLIVTYIFPPYFAQFVIGDPVQGQAAVSEATKWAGVIGALTAPILGAMMDRGGARKPLMAVFIAMLVVSGAGLWWSLPGGAGLGVAGTMSFLVLGFVGYTYSELTHNAMLRSAGRPESLSQISGAGIGLGQLSSALCLVGIVVLFSAAKELGGAEGGFALQRGTGPFVAVWLLVFVLPFFLFMPDGKPEGGAWAGAAKKVFSKNGKLDPIGAIFGCFSYIAGLFRTYPETMKYLLACLIFKDGITALLALGGVYSSGVLGWNVAEGGLYGIWASIFGAIGGLWLAGLLDRNLGPRRSIMLQLALLCICVVIALGITKNSIFYGVINTDFSVYDSKLPFHAMSDWVYLGVIAIIAMLAAANISTARYMMITLAPKERVSEFFGLFALSATATVWLGPLLTEYATRISGDQRIGFSPVLFLLAVGLALMFALKKTTGAKGKLTGDADAPPAH